MKNLIKFTLIISVLTFLFMKVYVPLMYEEDGWKDIRKTSIEKANNALKKKSLVENGLVKTKVENHRISHNHYEAVILVD